MKAFTCTNFTAFNPVGSAAVIIAKNHKDAARQLQMALKEHGLPGTAIGSEGFILQELGLTKPTVFILVDGNC